MSVTSPVRHVHSGYRNDPPDYVPNRAPYAPTRRDPQTHLLLWILRGAFDVVDAQRTNDETQIGRAQAGDLILLPPHVPLQYSPIVSTGWEWIWVHFAGPEAEAVVSVIPRPDSVILPLGFDESIRARFRELITHAASTPSELGALRTDACLFSLITLIATRRDRVVREQPAVPDIDLTEILGHIDANLHTPLTLHRIADASGYSRSHLNRQFRSQLGLTPMQYVTRTRIARASELLSSTNLRIGEIGRIVGYDDPYYFSRRFKQATGVAPLRYRNTNQRRLI